MMNKDLYSGYIQSLITRNLSKVGPCLLASELELAFSLFFFSLSSFLIFFLLLRPLFATGGGGGGGSTLALFAVTRGS